MDEAFVINGIYERGGDLPRYLFRRTAIEVLNKGIIKSLGLERFKFTYESDNAIINGATVDLISACGHTISYSIDESISYSDSWVSGDIKISED